MSITVDSVFAQNPTFNKLCESKELTKFITSMPDGVKSCIQLVRFTIYDNHIHLKQYIFEPHKGWDMGGGREIVFKDYLEKIKLSHKLPNVDFVVATREELHDKWVQQYQKSIQYSTKEEELASYSAIKASIKGLPLFLFSKDTNMEMESNKFLLPDTYIIQDELYRSVMEGAKRGSLKYSWEAKLDVAFFRGVPSGINFDFEAAEAESSASMDSWKAKSFAGYFPRVYLVSLSKQYPSYIDAKLTSWGNNDWWAENAIKLKSINITKEDDLAPGVSPEDSIEYKYLLSLDGFKCAWMRVPWILASNSVLLKTETTEVEWFFDKLLPNIHYVPIKPDLSDLVDTIKWLRNNEQYAKRIAEAGSEFVSEYLTQEKIVQNTIDILYEYAAVQKFKLSEVNQYLLNNVNVDIDTINMLLDLSSSDTDNSNSTIDNNGTSGSSFIEYAVWFTSGAILGAGFVHLQMFGYNEIHVPGNEEAPWALEI